MTNLQRIDEDNRGVSPVIGFVMIIVIIVMMMGFYQTSIVPSMSEQAEINANQELKTQSLELNSKISSSLADNTPLSQPVGTSISYPPRVGKPQVGYGISGSAPATYEISGTLNESYSNQTEFYTTYGNYVQTNSLPTFHYEHGMTVVQTEGKYIPLSNQPIIHDDRIYIFRLTDVPTSSALNSLSVQIYPKEQMHKVSNVTNSADNHVTVTLPTKIPESTWNSLLEEEFDENGGHITDVRYTTNSDSPNTVTIELEQGVDYSFYRGTADLETQ